MKPELLQKLKDADYPMPKIYVMETVIKEGEPTLEQLIEACGDDFYTLRKGSGVWYAESDLMGTFPVGGAIPKEAVANLYIALNNK